MLIDKKIKKRLVRILPFVLSLFCSCEGNLSYKMSDYAKKSESCYAQYGKIQYDTLLSDLDVYKIVKGDSIVIVYEREGTTFVNANDYEAKYYEYLIFELDTIKHRKFQICDALLSEINCKYYWVCLSKEPKKEIRNIDKGCIDWQYYGDSLRVKVDVNVDFSFGGFLEKRKERSFQQEKLIKVEKR